MSISKNILAIALIIATVSLIAGCSNSYKHLTSEEALEMIQSDSTVLVLDVRTEEEYRKKHIPNALLLPIADIKEGKLEALPDKNQKILIYCWTGRRAEDAAQFLVDRGYTNVFEFGGLVTWTGEVEGETVGEGEEVKQ